MKKKLIFKILLVVIIFILISIPCVRFFVVNSKVNSINKNFIECKKRFYDSQNYYASKACFEKLINETNKIEYKYYHALTLFQTMEFDNAKNELKEIINNSDKIKNKKLVEKSKNIYNFLNSTSEKELIYFIKYNDVELSEENSQRLDIGDYVSDLSKIAIWQNPQKIRVYIGKSNKEKTIKKAFEIWDEALGSMLNFTFVADKKSADITCFCVKNLDDIKLGSTKTFFKEDKLNNAKYLTKAKIQIVLFEPETDNLIDDTNILSTTLHEIGHSLGIISHSKQKGDIMYFDSSSYKQEKAQVSQRDINTVKKIYGNI